VEISPANATSLGLKNGDEVRVGQNGSAVNARVAIKERIEQGVCFLVEGTRENNANSLARHRPFPVKVEITKANE
jgi:anaerobic selenocysteine-containing dehydrogenase